MTRSIKAFAAGIFVVLMLPVQSFAISNVNAGAASVCSATGNMLASGGTCRSTPTKYGITIYEMGLCVTHPYGTSKIAANFDDSTCVTTYTNPTATEVDLAANIGGVTSLPGTSTAPAPGTYFYPYIVMGSTFTVSGEFTNSGGTTFRSDGGGNANGATVADQTDSLVQFGNSASTCYSGYIGAAVTGGTIDGFITNTSLTRGSTASSGDCVEKGRVVGIMNLSTPVAVTQKTFSVVFNFLLTDNGIQWNDGDSNGANGPEGFGSAPFAGYFTIQNAD